MKNAFTLAEVLITLGIIGVISALTLPAIIQNQKNKEIVTRLQKTYSILSQAVLFAQNEYGPSETWNIVDNNQNSTREIFSYFEPHLKIIRKCGNKSGCWADTTKSLSGQTVRWSGNFLGVHFINFTLNDGTTISYDHCNANYDFFGLPSDIHIPFITIVVDVNGDKKPNILGRDTFGFAIYKNKLIPFGIGNNAQNCDKSINSDTSGYGCTYKVLQEKTINY